MLAWIPLRASGEVDLEWRAEKPVVHVGGVAAFGLYAVSDDDTDQGFVGVQAILAWDPNVMELTGLLNNSSIDWGDFSSFPSDCADMLNADCGPDGDCGKEAVCVSDGECDGFCNPYSQLPFNDGDAFYFAFLFPIPDPRPMATPQGTLVVTVLFAASAEGETVLTLPAEAGEFTTTKISDVPEPGINLEVVGELRPGSVTIAACGTKGDFTDDCVVDGSDVAPFVVCLSDPNQQAPGPECQPADIDGNGLFNLRDIALFQLIFDPLE